MTRVLRYPRITVLLWALTFACALLRDLCIGASLFGWADVLLPMTAVLMAASLAVMSCRFLVDEQGVGVGFLLRMRRTDWEDIASFGVLYCNTRRRYVYGMYRGGTDFLNLLHHAPLCGAWGFVAPASTRLMRAILRHCPFGVNLDPLPPARREGRLRLLWHHAAVCAALMVPAAVLAFLTAGTMIVYAAGVPQADLAFFLTIGAAALAGSGAMLLYRVNCAAVTCPAFSEEGVCAGRGLYLRWNDVRFGYVHRMRGLSGMFMLSRPLEEVRRRGAKPILCLSVPDTTTMVLAYLTYCPHAQKQEMDLPISQ